MMSEYSAWLGSDPAVPKLYVHAEPGTLAPWIQRTVSSWPNLRTATARGLHFLQEDDPDTIGKHVQGFIQELYQL